MPCDRRDRPSLTTQSMSGRVFLPSEHSGPRTGRTPSSRRLSTTRRHQFDTPEDHTMDGEIKRAGLPHPERQVGKSKSPHQHTAGIAADGDEQACRWIAVRHAPDHRHARTDGVAVTPAAGRRLRTQAAPLTRVTTRAAEGRVVKTVPAPTTCAFETSRFCSRTRAGAGGQARREPIRKRNSPAARQMSSL